ncbi:MAG: hypothetical protein ACI8S6_001017 [Myxococcota bacterium]|jgi:hypothetical protein
MKRLLSETVCALLLLSGCADKVRTGGEATARAPTRWAALLGEATASGWTDYDLIARRRSVLDDYLAWTAEHGPISDNWSYSKEDRSIAFLANAYNAAVIAGVLAHQPLQSVKDVSVGVYRSPPGTGFFLGQQFKVDGQWVSLYTLEHQYLLGQFEDPFIHVMLNCASVGCPPPRYWNERKLDHQVETALTAYLDSPQGIRQGDDGRFAVTELFSWFGDQLVDWSAATSTCEFLAPYAPAEARAWLESEHERGCAPETFAYDWSLNDRAGD